MKKILPLLLAFVSMSAAESFCEKTVTCQEPCDGENSESYMEDMINCRIEHERLAYWEQYGCDLAPASEDCNLLGVAIDVKASKSLKNQGKNTYDAKNLLAVDEKVWAATFTGEPIKLNFTLKGKFVYGLAVMNGYKKDKKTYDNNSRIKTMTVYADGKKVESFTLMDRSYEDIPGYDEITFKKPVEGAKILTIEIESIYVGKKWKDVCVDEIVVVGQ